MKKIFGWPEPQFVKTNGINMAVYQAGSQSSVPPIILCHGSPELAFSWRHQLTALSQAGLRVIVPDQRGYGLTDRPPNVSDYHIKNLIGDLVGLLDSLEIEKAIFCGHDWGALVVWRLALCNPERVSGVIGLNTPFYPLGSLDPISVSIARNGGDYFYRRVLNVGEAEAIFSADVEKVFRFVMRRPFLDINRPDLWPIEWQRQDIFSALSNFDPSQDTNLIFDEDALAFYVETFKRTGFSGSLNWYRNIKENWNWERRSQLKQRIEKPTLMILSDCDNFFPPSEAEGMEKYIPQLEKVIIAGAGHHPQQEMPEIVSSKILEWVERSFK